MQPETAVANWQDWQVKPPCKPEILGPVDGGLSNQSYLLDAAGSRLVLRINATHNALPGIDRNRETIIWRAASKAGVAPRLLHTEAQFLVSEFVASDIPASAPHSEVRLSQAIGLLEKCHALNVNVSSLDYVAHIQHYWDLIEENGAKADASLIQQKQPMQVLLHHLLASQAKSVLCHHDPVKANFVGSAQRLYLIDWEYAAKGMAVMDFAALAMEWGVDDQAVLKYTNVQADEFNQAKTLYKYMCHLWATAQSRNRRIDKN